MTLDPAQLDAEGKKAFSNKKFSEAADLFRQAAQGYTLGRAGLLASEMKNNMSVALLQAGKPQEALDAALGTDIVFARTQDIKRQAMALGNIAAALHELGRNAEALENYDLAAQLFAQIGEDELCSIVKKSAAAVRLKDGKVTDAAMNMIGALDVKKKPSFFERILRFFFKFIK
jgi:tetratricopeptide (TPR) repeat protein